MSVIPTHVSTMEVVLIESTVINALAKLATLVQTVKQVQYNEYPFKYYELNSSGKM